MKKNIAILRSSSVFEDSRVTKWATELTSQGYNVQLIYWDRKNEHLGQSEFKLPNGISVPVLAYEKKCSYGAGFKNLFKMLGFHNWLKRQVKKLPSGTIVHACDYDTAKPISKLCGEKYKLVYDIFDFYVESHNLPKPLEKIVRKGEISVINRADATVICSEQRVEQIKGSAPKNLAIIHNTPNLTIAPKDCNPGEKLKVCFIGSLGYDRLLLEIVDKITDDLPFDFVFGGIGVYADKIKELSEKHKNVTYLGSMPYAEVLKIESECDVLFATYNPEIKNHKYSAPNKFYEAGCLQKPVIVCKDTGIDKLVDEHKTGLTIKYNADEFVEALKNLSSDRALYKSLAKNGREAYEKHFSWQIMSERIQKLYKSL